ncbi:MAG: DUF368 domain-containing protein [Defluviitaleaceae bacterium]|nr:DUF368 domain-containing protein [Defluviitaleaceae bacterium]MCL2263843.1 DUF368 domain-containing protein [Defluviitaleaceae bacterium]
MQVLFLFLKGIAVGGANVMPGVSGATLAVIFRIYDRLIESINNLFSDMKESLKFLIPIGLGMVVGILAVGEAIDFLLVRFSMQTGGFIAGLMAGSLPFIYSQCILEEDGKRDKRYILFAVAAAAFIILITLLAPEGDRDAVFEGATFNAALAAHLFIGGLFAAAAMVVPGVSGAMVLMLLGLFPIAMHTITNIREYLMSPTNLELLTPILAVVIPLGIGIVAGILLGSKLIAILLKKFHSQTYFVILGLVFGTIFVIFNDPATYQSHESVTPLLIAFTAITFICGAATSLLLGKRKD